jgi:predicted metal-binding membrane protein
LTGRPSLGGRFEGPTGAMTVAADDTVLEAVLRRDRQVVAAALIAVIAMAWLWILLGAGTGMSAMDMILGSSAGGMAGMMGPAVWTLGYAGVMFTMWWVMMAAMMLPSAAPILLLFARINRKEKSAGRPFIPTGIFAAGYLVAWGGFSAFATGLQWALERLGLLSPMMATTSYWLGGAILLAAGVWQLTPIKGMCLRHCRSPMGFLVQSWRRGRGGAFRMGLEHGSFCLGCCWFLMGLLFFGGIMNLFWIMGLAAFILLEKTVPMGSWIGRIVGVGVAAWGVLLLATTTLTIAAPSQYRFEIVDVPTGVPGTTTVAVRLVHVSDNKPVDGATIVDAKTDMGPAGMAEMSGKVTQAGSDHPGVYRFSIETGMAGKWELVLTAKVPGEMAPVTGKLIYDAK